jgi:hypothetical protein
MLCNIENIRRALDTFKGASPFDHCIVDDFFKSEVADALELDFPGYETQDWFVYKNSIEDKKALNNWNLFPDLTYKAFSELVSSEFIDILSGKLNFPLYQDPGLHGGGWHIHGVGGNLNPHYDYSIHPKIGLQRKINIIIYLSSNLEEKHGGHLGLWNHDTAQNAPGVLVKEIQPKFNRAVIFDTTQHSWHGMCRPLTQPEGIYRKSLAVYYLTEPPEGADRRQRALFAPRDDQKGCKSVEELILTRADNQKYMSVYRAPHD